MTQSIKKMAYGGLLIAIGIILPQLFHIFGQAAGQTFLPMHIPVMLAGMLIGPVWALGVAVIVPVLSSLITGMPAVPMLAKKGVNVYLNLAVTILCGRAVYGLSLVAAVNVFSFAPPFANATAFFTGLVSGLPGVALQFIVIPLLMFALRKGGLVLVKTK